MPPPSDQNNNKPRDSKPSKVTQKGPGTGAQTPKNGKKNGTAKDNSGGAVMAAVVKDANISRTTKSSAQNPNTQPSSPEIKPVNLPSNGSTNPVISPLLDALSSASFTQLSSQNTTEWARNVNAFSTSPSNLINLGESPPTLPSSCEDRPANFVQTMRESKQASNSKFQSISPPSFNRRKPLGYQQDSTSQGFDDHRSQISSYAARRSSMYSQQPRYGGPHHPLPHQAQAHFYGTPEANLMLSPPGPGLTPGESGYFCGFDSLPMSHESLENVIVAGYEGGLVIQSVTKRGLNKIAAIDGLRGGVCDAKILSWSSQGGELPLIALVIHGPIWASSGDPSGDDLPTFEAASVRGPASLHNSPRIAGALGPESVPIDYYQTTVEVFSLASKRHVSTLLTLPKTHVIAPTTGSRFRPPPPAGSLTLRADSGNLVATSGLTGETWIFRQAESTNSFPNFRCIGKVWTTVQHGVTVESASFRGQPDDEINSPDRNPVHSQYNASVQSLKGRWLAYCPPTPSSQPSLRATVPSLSSTAKIPGLNSLGPPQLPTINCMVDTPGDESMVKQLVQLGTQKFIEGATYLGGQGVQAWNNYWTKQPLNQSPGTIPYQTHANTMHHFPPTHGASTQTPSVTKEPGLISILDLEALAGHASQGSSTPHPLTTFKVPHGCSFLSFAPSGLALFTASSKGDVQFVWDLMRMQYAKPSLLKGVPQGTGVPGPHVRQIAQFSRMTIARIVDVVWTSPHGERAAMVTEPGTVHVLDLPASAFTWPPPRRRIIVPKPDEGNNEAHGVASTASSVASTAVHSLWTAAKPLVGRRRRSSAGVSTMTVVAQAGHGTQGIAAGISRSVGAATGRMNEMRKSGNAKLHLPPSLSIPSKGCVLLLHGRKSDSVIVVGGGIVRFYNIKNRRAGRPADKQKASRGAKFVEFRLSSLPNLQFAPQVPPDLELTERDADNARSKIKKSAAPVSQRQGTTSSIPQAEIESNAPYQPFHTDRRVGLYVYSSEDVAFLSPSASALLSLTQQTTESESASSIRDQKGWAFGGPIKSTRVDVGPLQSFDDDFDPSTDHRALPSSAMERVMRITDSTEDIEQIVITTRRRKTASHSESHVSGNAVEEGFFEDDCEVLDFASQRV